MSLSVSRFLPAWGLAALLSGAPMAAWALDMAVQVLDREGKPLANAVVVAESTQSGPRPALPAEVTILQEKMKFVPAVSVVHLNTKVRFTNQDTWDHHVKGGLVATGNRYVNPDEGYAFRLAGRKADRPISSNVQSYTEVGPQLLGCHLHGSMQGHLYVTDSPWAAVTDADGRVNLRTVPYGPVRLRVWHPDELASTPVVSVVQTDALGPVKVSTQIMARRKRGDPMPMSMPGY
jgi:plastocyanin